MNNLYKCLLSVGFFFTFLLVLAPIHAGGGSVQSANFTHGQAVKGKSFQPEVIIMSPESGYLEPVSAGKKFKIEANSNLDGAKCSPLGDKTDKNGRIKANCKAKEYGKFEFNVIDVENNAIAGIFEVKFTKNGIDNVYSVEISPKKNRNVDVDEPFELHVILERDETVTTNLDNVDFFRWEVLEGNIVSMAAAAPKNQGIVFKMVEPIETKLRASVVLNDGVEIWSEVFTVKAD